MKKLISCILVIGLLWGGVASAKTYFVKQLAIHGEFETEGFKILNIQNDSPLKSINIKKGDHIVEIFNQRFVNLSMLEDISGFTTWIIAYKPQGSSYTNQSAVYRNGNKNEKQFLTKKEREIRAIKKKEALALAAAKKRKQKVSSLELSYGKECSGSMFSKGFTKGTKEYQNCLFAKEKEMIVRQKALEIKLAKMTPIQRREYNCEQTFKFRKGTNPFNQCVFKLYTTELEIEKLELQKQVAEANERAALAQAKAASSQTARKEAIANAQISAANAQVAAAKASARASSLASSIELMRMGSSMMKSPAPAPSGMGRVRTTCRNVGGFLNCY